MIIVFDCPGCGHTLRMKEQYGGQRGRCPNCQGAITVPAIETEAGMDLLPLEGATPSAPAPPANAPAPSFSLGSRLPSAGPGPAACRHSVVTAISAWLLWKNHVLSPRRPIALLHRPPLRSRPVGTA